MRTQLVVEENVVDLTDELATELTFAIDDVRNFASRNSNYSKTVVIPGTNQNNFIFGHIFKLDVFNTHNPAAQNVGFNYSAAANAKCEVYVDYMLLFKGVIRVLEIKITDGFVEYECSLVGELGGLAYAIEGKKLEDLDFSAYNHDYTIANIEASWIAPLGDGYYYPLIDYGKVSTNKLDYSYKALRPAFYVKEFIDKIFEGAGYTYESEFLSAEHFKKIIIPNNQFELANISINALLAAPNVTTYNSSGTSFSLGFTSSILGGFTYAGNAYTYASASSLNTDILLHIVGRWAAGGNATLSLRQNGNVIGSYTIGSAFSSHFFSANITVTDVNILTGDVFDVVVSWMGSQPYTMEILSGGSFNIQNTSAALVPINYGEAIAVNSIIPRNVLQKDFLTSIIKMFNLYVTEDRDKNKHLKIEPYINYYDRENVLDWTNKVDYKEISIKPLSEINSRKYEYKFKDDSDYYNDLYKKKYATAYGNRVFDTTYEFVKDTQSLDVIFSPTPLVQYAGTDLILPAILKINSDLTEDNKESNIRILYRTEALVPIGQTWSIVNGVTTLYSSTEYPYAGHLSDPLTPLLDLNFGAPQEFYFTFTGGYLSFNLFNVYWSAYMAEIADKDSKLLAASIRLHAADINKLDFSKYIFIGEQLFRLNKVEDYKPYEEDLTKVELLNVLNIDFAVADLIVEHPPLVGEYNDDFNSDFNIGG